MLIAINGRSVAKVAAVKAMLSKLRPGDLVKIRYSREGKETEVEVHLASRSRVEMAAEDFANHGTSTRTDDFPEVLQHDMPLSPTDMGAPLYDLQGFAVGLNIARVDRVTNFALPAEVFWPKVRAWIAQDQGLKHPAGAAATTAKAR
jgi:S1-C subfamily serine protease